MGDAWSRFTGKAAECRALVFVLREFLHAFGASSDLDRHRLRCYDSLCSIINCFFDYGIHIPEDAAAGLLQSCDDFLVHYNWLCHNGLESGNMHYNIVLKTHMLWHICYMARWINPRFCWAYEFEDFVGQMITSAKACMAGTPLRLVGKKVLQSYLMVLNLRLNRV